MLLAFLGHKNRDVEIPPSGIDVHVLYTHKGGTEVDLVDYVEDDHAGCANPLVEEVARDCGASHLFPADGKRTDPKLGDDDENVEGDADPGADHADLGLEGEL